MPLDSQDIEEALRAMIDGDTDPRLKSALLSSVSVAAASSAELFDWVKELRKHQQPCLLPGDGAIDVCGTGGDKSVKRPSTFNISTTVSFVLAGCGLPVIKHATRSVSSQSGSLDVLESLGIEATPPRASREQIERFLKHKLAVVATRHYFPAMSGLSDTRKFLMAPTILHWLMPLLNPVEVTYQLTGCIDPRRGHTMIDLMRQLGRRAAAVVVSEDGMDELSLMGVNHIWWLRDGLIIEDHLVATDIGLQMADWHAVRSQSPEENATLIHQILAGQIDDARRDIVLLNAACGLMVAERANSWADGLAKASESIRSGAALAVLHGLQAKLT